MNWIQIIANYILIGALVCALLDWINSKTATGEGRFENKERLILVVFWPLAVGNFLYHFFKS